jgi:hypothetical protein
MSGAMRLPNKVNNSCGYFIGTGFQRAPFCVGETLLTTHSVHAAIKLRIRNTSFFDARMLSEFGDAWVGISSPTWSPLQQFWSTSEFQDHHTPKSASTVATDLFWNIWKARNSFVRQEHHSTIQVIRATTADPQL